jgi:hypothetical protein
VIARPGKIASQGVALIPLHPSATICPQLGKGGGTPNPMKLKTASVRMSPGIFKVRATITGPRLLGSPPLSNTLKRETT